jgi:hypothetical protein
MGGKRTGKGQPVFLYDTNRIGIFSRKGAKALSYD